ncbi:MAG: FAD-dependent oxidoreductase [Clostridiales bacterium]|nr:FAD-dependent oxidoreductase [Clostridiales bacterium]
MVLYDVIIVGGGPAGMTAGLYAARAGLKAVLLEGVFAGGQAAVTDTIGNYPGFPEGVGGPELMARFSDQAERAGLEIRYDGATALSLDGDVKSAVAGGEIVEGRTMILAMGATRRKLGVPGENELGGHGVSYCATCDGPLYRGKRVAVVGGGYSAVEDATFLRRIARVTLIHRRPQLRAQGREASELLTDPSIERRLGYTVSSIEKAPVGLKLNLRDMAGDEVGALPVDGVFVAVGTEPNTELVAGQLALDEHGYIPCGEDTITAIPGVFAAGDIRKKPLKQVVTAVSDGAVAAFAAGQYLIERG